MTNSPIIPAALAILRGWGVDVAIHRNAETNGRPGGFQPRAVMWHHTASSQHSLAVNSLRVVAEGRTGVPGPLSQFFVSRAGAITCVSYGRANHAGTGGPWRTIPKDTANGYSIGIELDNDGRGEEYNPIALRHARLLTAALLVAMRADSTWLLGHKEWAPSRKIDPLLAMNRERTAVAAVIAEKLSPPPKPVVSVFTRYTVKAGDTLWEIAAQNGTTVEALAALNGLRDADDIDPGQVLRMPALRSHVVVRGDTLTSIADKYGVTIEGIARVNRIGDLDNIQVGQRLRIPAPQK